MRIQVKTVIRGSSFSADPGAVVEVTDGFGRQLVAAGAAVELHAYPPAATVEEAVVPSAPEVSVAPEQSRRKGHR